MLNPVLRAAILSGIALAFAVAERAAAEGGALLLVLNKAEATLSIVDPGAGRELGRVAVGRGRTRSRSRRTASSRT
jgi:hypothetical protein